MGKNAYYTVGKSGYTQSDLNNKKSGTDANSIYYATHGGSGGSGYVSGANDSGSNSGSYVTFYGKDDPTPPTDGGDKTGGTTTTTNGASTLDYLNNLYASYAAQREAQLNAAYDRALNAANQGYEDASGRLTDNLNNGLGALRSQYENSKGNINTDANRSLLEAYVNKMKSMKNLGQQMAAQGLSGGATETTLAGMHNNYGNARNNIETTRATNLADLSANNDQNVANLYDSYNNNMANLSSQLASAISSLEMARANGMMDALDKQFSFQTSGSFLNALADAQKNAANYQATPTEASNVAQLLSTNQGSIENISNSNNGQLLEEILKLLSGAQA